jgi:hypothetical protein
MTIAEPANALIARNESVQDHPALVAQIDTKTRVVAYAARIQWIVQRATMRARTRRLTNIGRSRFRTSQ